MVAVLCQYCSYLWYISMPGIYTAVYSMPYYFATEVACQFLVIFATNILRLGYLSLTRPMWIPIMTFISRYAFISSTVVSYQDGSRTALSAWDWAANRLVSTMLTVMSMVNASTMIAPRHLTATYASVPLVPRTVEY